MAIDIGSEAINRSSYRNPYYTWIDLANAVEQDGILDTIEIWSVQDLVGAKVGIFYHVINTTYHCRSSVTIGDVTAGSKQTFSGLSLACKAGDFIGIYFTGGSIESGASGTALMAKVDYTGVGYANVGNQVSFSAYGNYAISLYGTGMESSVPQPPSTITYPETNSHGELEVSWSASEGATSYTLEQSDDDGENWTEIYVGMALSYFGNIANGDYIYRVMASNEEGNSEYTTGETITVDYTPVTLVKSENIAVKISSCSGGV